jgi:PiT family inorganic phosphate transporter
MATRTRTVRPAVGITILVAMVALGPLLVGTAVATTLAHRLVSFGGEDGRVALLAAVVTALVVVFVLTRRGTPTSLTLALTGGIVGAGLGAGLPVQWPTVAKVLVIGVAAPLLSIPAGWLLYEVMRGPVGRFVARRAISETQYVGYLMQCLAYSANDAQKMVAIVAIGSAAQLDPVTATVHTQLAIAALFGAGILLTVRVMASRVGEGVMYIRTPHFIATSIGSSCVVLATAALGVPVSSTQAATGAAVGSGIATSPFSVRWKEVSRIGSAWAVTLPLSIGLAAALAAAGRVVR